MKEGVVVVVGEGEEGLCMEHTASEEERRGERKIIE